MAQRLGGFLGSGGITLFGTGSNDGGGGGGTGIGVNSYLWRATLDTVSFMPITQADPFGGVINYDWFTDARAPNERFKTTVFILDSRLRADALNVSIVKEVRDENGQWVAQPVSPQTETDLENAILTRARQLNLSGAGS